MKLTHLLPLALCAFATTAFAAEKTYQVTGNVVELSDTKIVVLKGKENFEMSRNASTKMTGEAKVGSKVTVQYTITAVEVESKDAPKKEEKKKEEPAKKEDKKAAPAKK